MTDTCEHEKFMPKGNPDNWNMMNWDNDPNNKGLYVNMCKKCGLLYWVFEK